MLVIEAKARATLSRTFQVRLAGTGLHRVDVEVSMLGLYVYPALLPREIQSHLLSVLLHRDLSNPTHQTNVHMHYNVPYPRSKKEDMTSYFDVPAASLEISPKYPDVHKPITTGQFLNRKLRWMTLGGQYDWTRKVYPNGPPPAFPQDIKVLLEKVFPMKAEAAIVNLYSPGDTLSLHRDVSEECDQPLASISLGCDGIFVIGLGGDSEDAAPRVATLRLRSGDAVLMSGESRYAWHSVPRVVEGSCPDYLQDWPGNEYPTWAGWMSGKRINLNVRQMFN